MAPPSPASARGVEAHYNDALQRLGATHQLPPHEITKRYPPMPPAASATDSNSTGTQLGDDDDAAALAALHACKFYSDFAAAPHAVNAEREAARQQHAKQHGAAAVERVLQSDAHHEWKKDRQFDFRLQPHEALQLARGGVAVSQRMHAESFGEVYYRLYTDDLPVFITTDSILHAWHRSFDAALIDIETLECIPALTQIVSSAHAQCRDLLLTHNDSNSNSHVVAVLRDVDCFLTIALRLLAGSQDDSSSNDATTTTPTLLRENAAHVTELWHAIAAQRTAPVTLFGATSAPRDVDFSLFQPRGHYTKTPALQAYSRAVTWLSTIDLRVAGTCAASSDTQTTTQQQQQEAELYELQTAVALVAVLRATANNGLASLQSLDALIASLVGDSDRSDESKSSSADALTPFQLDALLPSTLSPTELLQRYVTNDPSSSPRSTESSNAALLALQQTIVARGDGTQRIAGHPFVATTQQEPTTLPIAFAFFPPRFTWSAFVWSRTVFDQIVHDKNKVARRIPSAMDVGFALLRNNAAGAIAADRMMLVEEEDEEDEEDTHVQQTQRQSFDARRDGLPYATNLLALRSAIDTVLEQQVHDTTAHSISSLWLDALRALAIPTTHASHVFHSSTWERRQLNTQLASFTQLRHDALLYTKQSYTFGTRCEYAAGLVDPYPLFYHRMATLATHMATLLTTQLPHVADDVVMKDTGASLFREFADTMATLATIATQQIAHQPLNEEQTDFIKTVMEERFGSGATKYAGWYPRLFYAERQDAGKRDVLVADVHTDVPSIEHNDPHGGVLHVGVGDVHVGFVVADGVVYSGPMFSSYEFVSANANERFDDAAFCKRIDANKALTGGGGAFAWSLASALTTEESFDSAETSAPQTQAQSTVEPVTASDWALASFLCGVNKRV